MQNMRRLSKFYIKGLFYISVVIVLIYVYDGTSSNCLMSSKCLTHKKLAKLNKKRINISTTNAEVDLKSLCKCKPIINLKRNSNSVDVNLKTEDNESKLINLYSINYNELTNTDLSCDLYNSLKRGKEQNVISVVLDSPNRVLIKHLRLLVSLAKNIYPKWLVRVYYDQNHDDRIGMNKLKCEVECKYINVDFCNVNKLTDKHFVDLNHENANGDLWKAKDLNPATWKWLPVGDRFVDLFLSIDLTKFGLLDQHDSIMNWSNSDFQSILFENNYKNWGFRNSKSRKVAAQMFSKIKGLANKSNNFSEEYYFKKEILPLAIKNSMLDKTNIESIISITPTTAFNINDVAEKEPLVSFGLIADVQYADHPVVFKIGERFYRNSLNLLSDAVENWRSSKYEIKFIMLMGDLIDGWINKRLNQTDLALNLCLSKLESLFPRHDFSLDYSFKSKSTPKILSLWGNHEVYAFGREYLANSRLATAKMLKQVHETTANYFIFDLTERLRLISLDSYDLSPLGHGDTGAEYEKAMKVVIDKETIYNSSKNELERDYLLRYRYHDGGISETQFKWLKTQLEISKALNKKVLLTGHIPLVRESSDANVMWNSVEILKLLWSYDNLVIAYVCGHVHVGGYHVDHHNIHHLTLNSILLTRPNTHNSYATAYVYENAFVLKNQNPTGGFAVYF